MVFFVCDSCNETLKKNQVDKHCFKCRSCQSVTCVDCSVTFWGNDFASHISCISEAEKYEKTLHKPKVKLNPQDAWMELINTAIAQHKSAPVNIQSYLVRLADFGNVPRNRKKFDNFVGNSLKLHTPAIIDSLWKFISDLQAKEKSTTADNSNASVAVAAVVTKASVPEAVPLQPAADEEHAIADDATEKKDKKKKSKKRSRDQEVRNSTELDVSEIEEPKEELLVSVDETSTSKDEEEESDRKKHKKEKKSKKHKSEKKPKSEDRP